MKDLMILMLKSKNILKNKKGEIGIIIKIILVVLAGGLFLGLVISMINKFT